MAGSGGTGKWRRLPVSSMPPLKDAARAFCPPYEVQEVAPWALRITLSDTEGRRPNLVLAHRNVRRLFLKANYLTVTSSVGGAGPEEDGEITFKFRGWFSRQRASLRWTAAVSGGDEWLQRLEPPLLGAVREVEAVQSLGIRWSANKKTWRLRLETMSGSMVSGITSMLPIAVPFDRKEAEGIISMIDTLVAIGRPLEG